MIRPKSLSSPFSHTSTLLHPPITFHKYVSLHPFCIYPPLCIIVKFENFVYARDALTLKGFFISDIYIRKHELQSFNLFEIWYEMMKICKN